MLERRGRNGKKREASGPVSVHVVQLVGALLYIGNRLREAEASAETDEVAAAGLDRLQAQGDLAESQFEEGDAALPTQGVQPVEYMDALCAVGDGCGLCVGAAGS